MKIAYFADGPWAHQALDKILSTDNLEVLVIIVRDDHRDPVLMEKAKAAGIPCWHHPNVNSEEFLKQIKDCQADIFVSMSFNQIFKKEIIQIASKGVINCHAGALPQYRGRNILNWALINGESEFGITVHQVNEGIDDGDILLQKMVPILPQDDYGTLLDKSFEACSDTLLEALILIEKNKIKPISQKSLNQPAWYCSRRGPGDEWIDWNWSSERIHNFIRSITHPGPGARAYIKGQQWALIKSELIPHAPDYIDIPGKIVGRDQSGVVIKTGTSTLKLTLVCQKPDQDPTTEKPRFPIGTKFLSRKDHLLNQFELEFLKN